MPPVPHPRVAPDPGICSFAQKHVTFRSDEEESEVSSAGCPTARTRIKGESCEPLRLLGPDPLG